MVKSVTLPPGLHDAVVQLLWSPSSTKVLLSTADQVHVFAVVGPDFHAVVRNPACLPARSPSLLRFGAHDGELIAWSALGIKVAFIHLTASAIIEVNNPKFYLSASATRGLSIRPRSHHLALLTRTGAKDFVSIHHPTTRQVQKSWSPDTVDAQFLTWTPDGRWLIVCESQSQGHRILLYTPDGHHFRTIGTQGLCYQRKLYVRGPGLASGIKICQLSPDSSLCAVADQSRVVSILRTETWRAATQLLHPSIILPRESIQVSRVEAAPSLIPADPLPFLKVWQEHLSDAGEKTQAFVRAVNMVAPPGPVSDSRHPLPLGSGCSLLAFDASSSLLATRLDDSPSAVWIWDLTAAELRAVLIFHSTVSFAWHPSIREVLLVSCRDEARRGTSFVWDPISNGPQPIIPADYLPGPKAANPAAAKPQVSWLNRESDFPELLLTDHKRYLLLSLSDLDDRPSPWKSEGSGEQSSDSSSEPTDVRLANFEDLDTTPLDDTFSFLYV